MGGVDRELGDVEPESRYDQRDSRDWAASPDPYKHTIKAGQVLRSSRLSVHQTQATAEHGVCVLLLCGLVPLALCCPTHFFFDHYD
jgi:hypothetical protein